MADINKTIEVVFSAVDETGRVFNEVGKGLKSIEDGVSSVTDPLANFTTSLLKTEAALAAVGVAFLGFSFNESVKFGAALTDLGKLLDGGVDQANTYKDEIFDLSETYGVSSVAIAESFATFRQAGQETDDAFQLVIGTLKQTAASELEAGEATESLVRIFAGFGLEASDISRVLDLINETTDKYATNTGQLSEALARTSSVASGANLSLEETIGILTPMIEVTQSAELASTAFNTTMQRMGSLNSEVAKGFDILGISQTDATGAIKSGSVILREAQEAFGGLSDSNKTLVAQYLAGQDQATKFRTVLEQGNKTLEITRVAVAGVGVSLDKELKIKLASASIQIDQTQQSFINLATAIGDKFKVEATGAIDATGELAKSFRTLVESGGLDPLFDQLRPLLGEFENTIRNIAKNLPEAFKGINLKVLTDAFSSLGDEVSELFGNIDLNTAEGLQAAIQNLVNIGAKFIETTAGIVRGLTPFLQTLGELATEFGELDVEVVKSVGLFLGVATAVNALIVPVRLLGASFVKLGGAAKSLGTAGLLKFMTDLSGGAASAVGAVGGAKGLIPALAGKAGLVGAAGVAGVGIGTLWSDIVNKLIPGVDTIGTKFFELINPAEASGKAFENIGTAAGEASTQLDLVAGGVVGVVEPVVELEKSLFSIKEGFGLTGFEVAKLNQELESSAKSFTNSGDLISEYNGQLATTEEHHGTLFKVITDATTGQKTYSQAVDITSTSLDKTSKKADKAKDSTEKFIIEMEKIASNERIKNIEAKISLDVAELEAETKQVQAAFTSIDSSVQSTGDLLGSLFGSLNDASRWNQLIIEDQIDLENERREKALKKQNELIDAQVANLKEKTRALAKGDALIKIEGDGLQPQLEAFMWAVLDAIQVRANAEGSEFLLGVT